MRINGIVAFLVLVAAGCSREPPPPAPAPPIKAKAMAAPVVPEPDYSIDRNLSMGLFEKIDGQVDKYVATNARDVDGRPKLFVLELEFKDYLDLPGTDAMAQEKTEAWQKDFPASAYRPIVDSMILNAAAWRARGHGFANSVTPEGWKLFHERMHDAWQMLMANRQTSSRIPSWYAHAIETGLDAGVSAPEIRELFHDGLTHHPGYFPIYFSYLRNFAPRWGGSFREADRFIREQVAAPVNVDGEMLYARLYWVLDQIEGQDESLFRQSNMSWPRMRAGFEAMMKAYPDSEWNRANFAAYACRAHDADSYGLLRPKVQDTKFWNAAPEGLSLDVCDARFRKAN
jgi:hypothetical protein